MNNKERILIIAAHPDDEILGCGGTIAKYTSKKYPVRVVFLGEGITARYQESEFSSENVQTEIRVRNDNAIKALGVLGIPGKEIYLGSRYCCRFDQIPIIDLVKEIESHIQEFKPTKLFSHAANDANIDHCIVHKALLSATRPINISFLKSILTFEVLSSTEWNATDPFHAQVFEDITEFMDLKIKALAAYEDEMRDPPHPRSEDVVRSLACYRGTQCGIKYAEGFGLVRSLC